MAANSQVRELPPPRPQPHPGSDYSNRNCRCDNCRAWQREKQRVLRAGLSGKARYSVCDVPGCPRPVYARDYCNLHYLRDMAGRDLMAPPHGEQHSCIHGHLYDEKNTRVDAAGNRSCRECDRIRKQEERDRARQVST